MSEVGSVLSILIVLIFVIAAVVDLSRTSGSGLVAAAVLASAVPVVLGTLALTQATAGVGVIAVGCWLAIIGRIMQAERHNKQEEPGPPPTEETMARLRREAEESHT